MEMMKAEEMLTLLRNRSAELRQQCEVKMSSVQTSEAAQTEDQSRIRYSADADFQAADELDRLIEQVQGG
jgi:hypothetical protein